MCAADCGSGKNGARARSCRNGTAGAAPESCAAARFVLQDTAFEELFWQDSISAPFVSCSLLPKSFQNEALEGALLQGESFY